MAASRASMAERRARRQPTCWIDSSFHGGTPCKAAANLLDRQFDVTEPDTAWASDFTFIRTHEGWMYLAVVIDLFSRQVVGWAMRDRADTELVVQALLSAVWRRKPSAGCLVHSDQGSV